MCPTLDTEGGPVYAIFADGRAHSLVSRISAPEGARVFSSYEEMGKLPVEELDRITMGLLKAQVLTSRTHGEALDRAWTATLSAARALEAAEHELPRSGKRSKARPVKVERTYTLSYDPASPGNAISIVIAALPPQAQACLQIFANAGRSMLTQSEVKSTLATNSGGVLRTSQTPWRIFMYYRKVLRERGLLMFDDEPSLSPSVAA